jgi:N-dimethylarginine dimethylaminohydrolase
MNLTAAYQGKGWKPRRAPMTNERDGRLWSRARVDSEFMPLESVLLFIPGKELDAIRRPRAVQHHKRVSRETLAREMRALAAAYRKCGVRVEFVKASRKMGAVPPNLVFQRDLFFNTREGVVLSRMASAVRAGEEKFTAAALAALAVPIRASISGKALFEGADALWLNASTVLIGVGGRSNVRAFKLLSALLKDQGVTAIAVKMPKGVQHLLGILQIVGHDLAIVRAKKAGSELRRLLKKFGYRLLEAGESDEVVNRQALNFVTVRPREVIMAKGCPEMRAFLAEHGIRIAAEVEISQLRRAAGGIACATGILSRRLRHD